MKWLEDVLPQGERWNNFSRKLIEVGSVMKEVVQIGKKCK